MYDFKQRAKLLGLSSDDAFHGVRSIPNLQGLQQILDDGKTGATSGDLLYKGIKDPDKNDHTANLSRKILKHAYGSEKLAGDDLAEAQTAGPLQVNVISIPEKTIDGVWNLNDETRPGGVIVSIGTLTIKDGGCITISNRLLDFTVDRIVRDGAAPPPSGLGTFNILGVDGATGQAGAAPAEPGQARGGAPGNCSSAGIAGASGGNGTPGVSGATGNTGGRGADGKPSLEAVIRITQGVTSSVQLPILTRSGAGGKGGQGSAGSKGGRGGNGGHGATCGCTGSAGGSGAQGGKGGAGGNGGAGGTGVDAAGNVIIHLPAAAQSMFSAQKQVAPRGQGGDPGPRGDGGDGGAGGSGGKHNSGGSGGGKGPLGEPGNPGAPGTADGQPADILLQPV